MARGGGCLQMGCQDRSWLVSHCARAPLAQMERACWVLGGIGSLFSPSPHLASSASLHPYSFLNSIPLGRSSYKEQYLFIYR